MPVNKRLKLWCKDDMVRAFGMVHDGVPTRESRVTFRLVGPPLCQYQLQVACGRDVPHWEDRGPVYFENFIERVGPIKMATSLSQRITTN